MTEPKMSEALVADVKKAAVHFSKASIELVSGIGVLAAGMVRAVRRQDTADDMKPDGPQKIEIE